MYRNIFLVEGGTIWPLAAAQWVQMFFQRKRENVKAKSLPSVLGVASFPVHAVPEDGIHIRDFGVEHFKRVPIAPLY